jgi:hypothetical protein
MVVRLGGWDAGTLRSWEDGRIDWKAFEDL